MPPDSSKIQVLKDSRQEGVLSDMLDRLKGLLGISLSEHSPRLLDPPKCKNYKNGRQEWRLRGRLHRLDGPAIVHADGFQEWYLYGRPHRYDGPSAFKADGSSQFWCVHGLFHRLDGPAITRSNGTQEWYVQERRHRLDGPAVVQADGTEEWWIDGHDITHLSAHAKLLEIQAYARVRPDAI